MIPDVIVIGPTPPLTPPAFWYCWRCHKVRASSDVACLHCGYHRHERHDWECPTCGTPIDVEGRATLLFRSPSKRDMALASLYGSAFVWNELHQCAHCFTLFWLRDYSH